MPLAKPAEIVVGTDGFAAATYNIHRCVGHDRRRDAARLLSVLERLDAPVIALQEVETLIGRGSEHDQFVYLAAGLGMHAIAGPAMFNPDSTYGNALLTRFPIRSVRRHDLSLPGREPRGAVEVELLVGHRAVRVIGTHLGLSGRERMRQCRVLARLLAARPSIPALLMGDFNEWLPFSRALKLLRAYGDDHGARTFPAAAPLLALDRAIVTCGLTVRSVRAFTDGQARRASDHLPLRIDVDFT